MEEKLTVPANPPAPLGPYFSLIRRAAQSRLRTNTAERATVNGSRTFLALTIGSIATLIIIAVVMLGVIL
jgi:hypothetical protein